MECKSAIDNFNELTEQNGDILDVTHELTSGQGGAKLVFRNGKVGDNRSAIGEWDPSSRTISVSRQHLNNSAQRNFKHELGHAYSLTHQSNHTKNFMSYYKVGTTAKYSSDSDVSFQFNQEQKSMLKYFNKPEEKSWWQF
ncbi:hypothetical protein [Pseudoalteromonas piscicida]|uniref:Peptidase M10 metallopeptidase domain-containing protein n=1 Tax=Pseudoalteromonas piscicida TaxID=43662 RepID=A0A2A5JJG0_PSEO7|nr:hypothetical protein [Pseudoalteromonas piscicida]PCK29584.1 hypothetical protein CEX98_22050 [Pseudoalteromonas piscicida]